MRCCLARGLTLSKEQINQWLETNYSIFILAEYLQCSTYRELDSEEISGENTCFGIKNCAENLFSYWLDKEKLSPDSISLLAQNRLILSQIYQGIPFSGYTEEPDLGSLAALKTPIR